MNTHPLLGENLLETILKLQKLVPKSNLFYYWHIMWTMPNASSEYHGLTHTTCVAWKCAQAGLYYFDRDECSLEDVCCLIIAAILHDYGHSKKTGSDEKEIKRALTGLRKCILPQNKAWLPRIEKLIRATQFPHVDTPELTELELAIRDADCTQSFEQSWQELICYKLAKELRVSPMDMLLRQEAFLTNVLKIRSQWGKTVWTKSVIQGRVLHVRLLISILKKGEAVAKKRK
ncbi:MAG: HD domain-containing protein [bacterium]